MAADLMVRIDGKTIPLKDCKWVLLDDNGCARSSSWGDEYANAEQAHKAWTPRQRDRERQARKGFTILLVTNWAWHADIRPCFYGTCQHRAVS